MFTDQFVPVVILVAVFFKESVGEKVAFADDAGGYVLGRSREETGIVRPKNLMLLHTKNTRSDRSGWSIFNERDKRAK